MSTHANARMEIFFRWGIRFASATFSFAVFYYSVPPLYAEDRRAALNAILPGATTHGEGPAGKLNPPAKCSSDGDCGAGFNNTLVCKTFIVNYTNGSAPDTSQRCALLNCPSSFVDIMLNGGSASTPVADIADILKKGGEARQVTLTVPSPAVNFWDPRYYKCRAEEAATSRPCKIP